MMGIGKSRNKKRVLAILDRFTSRLTPEEITEVRELVVTHEQPGAALSLISNWLFEYQVEISQEDFSQIQTTCEKMEMPQSSWEILESIVRD